MIFYFTATGNSKFIAERIAAATGDQIVNIAACVKDNRYDFELKSGENMGIVIPIYFYGIPMIVSEFLEKLKIKNKSYCYAVLNCGGSTANAEKFITEHLKLNAVFGVKTVDNYVPMFKMESTEKVNEKLNHAEREIDEIIVRIKKRDGGVNKYKGAFAHFITPVLYSFYVKGRKTNKFIVNDRCIKCGLCEKICPRKVIKLNDGRPVWTKPQCELCFACLHRCPESAIDYGKKTMNNGRYLNNRTKL